MPARITTMTRMRMPDHAAADPPADAPGHTHTHADGTTHSYPHLHLHTHADGTTHAHPHSHDGHTHDGGAFDGARW